MLNAKESKVPIIELIFELCIKETARAVPCSISSPMMIQTTLKCEGVYGLARLAFRETGHRI